jgi:uncharacterized Tic20 family protein
MSPQDERMWAALCHLAAFAGLLAAGLLGILGPLIVWLLKKDQSPLVDDQGKEAVNFQLSMLIYGLICVPTLCIFIGFVLLPSLVVLNVVLTVVAAVRANQGIAYRYPLTLRLIR